jgi:hypothetical protein
LAFSIQKGIPYIEFCDTGYRYGIYKKEKKKKLLNDSKKKRGRKEFTRI